MLANAIKKRLSKEEGQKGFTLIELLAVIVILGIIAVIAIPLIGNIINKSKGDADIATARQIYDAARLYIISKDGNFASQTVKITDSDTTTEDLVQNGFLDANLVLPSSKSVIDGGTVKFNASGQLEELTIKTAAITTAKSYPVADVIASKPSSSSAPAASSSPTTNP